MITERIQKAIDIFLDAINNGTLAKGTCAACAVGNLVGYEMDIKPEIVPTFLNGKTPRPNTHWMSVIRSCGEPTFSREEGKRQCDLTDFSIEELNLIEQAFENNTTIMYFNYDRYTKEEIRADQIKGLEAVIKVMLEFDGQKDDVKKVFTSKAELIPV